MYQLANALLASKLSYHEFSRTYRILIRAIKNVVNSVAYLEAVKDETQNVLDARFFKIRDHPNVFSITTSFSCCSLTRRPNGDPKTDPTSSTSFTGIGSLSSLDDIATLKDYYRMV